jgi:poly(A) polymerase
MREAAILAPILPEVGDLTRLRGLQGLDEPAGRDPLLRLAALLPDDAGVARLVSERLRLSNDERAWLELLARPPAPYWPAHGGTALRRALHRLGADIVRDLGLLALACGDAALGRPAVDAAATWTPVTLPVRGQDALDLGLSPGPQIGRLVEAVEAWWEENDYRPDRSACLAKLKELAAKT